MIQTSAASRTRISGGTASAPSPRGGDGAGSGRLRTAHLGLRRTGWRARPRRRCGPGGPPGDAWPGLAIVVTVDDRDQGLVDLSQFAEGEPADVLYPVHDVQLGRIGAPPRPPVTTTPRSHEITYRYLVTRLSFGAGRNARTPRRGEPLETRRHRRVLTARDSMRTGRGAGAACDRRLRHRAHPERARAGRGHVAARDDRVPHSVELLAPGRRRPRQGPGPGCADALAVPRRPARTRHRRPVLPRARRGDPYGAEAGRDVRAEPQGPLVRRHAPRGRRLPGALASLPRP